MRFTDVLRRTIPQKTKNRIKQRFGLPLTKLHRDWQVLDCVGPLDAPHVVLDVGAHHGWFFHCWLDWCPEAEVYAFEPTPKSFNRMFELYGHDPRVHLFQLGVGAEPGEGKLNVLEDSQVSNSFLKPQQSTWDVIEYKTGTVSSYPVSVTTLDGFCAEENIPGIYLLKIDVQGFELAVLEGSMNILPSVDYVFVESGIRRLYEGAPSFADVFLFMESQGFHLMHLRTWHRGNRVLVETDMIFRRNDLAPEVDRSCERYYLELSELLRAKR